jgi:hypothetical protein
MYYQDKYIKYKTKYNNLKMHNFYELSGGGPTPATVLSSKDNITYIQGQPHHMDILVQSRAHNFTDNIPFNYNAGYSDPKYNVVVTVIPIDKITFVCIRPNNTFFYLKYVPETILRFEKRYADKDIITDNYGKSFTIKAGKHYYFDNLNNRIMIGYHNSIDPPTSPDDVPLQLDTLMDKPI